MFQVKVAEKIKTRFMFNNFFFFRKPFLLCDNIEEYGRARQATGNNIV